jgi:hypothetical protein
VANSLKRGVMSDLNELFEDPSAKVDQFRSTYAMLKSSPDVEPPRRIMFEFEKPRTTAWLWRWLAPMAASAAVAFAVVSFAPRPQPAPVVFTAQAPVVQAQPVAQPIDYQKIIDELRPSEQAWLANELKKQDAAHSRDIQQVEGQLAVLDSIQRAVRKETIENAASIQYYASK